MRPPACARAWTRWPAWRRPHEGRDDARRLCLGGNLFGEQPRSRLRRRRALASSSTIVVSHARRSTRATSTGAAEETLILPVLRPRRGEPGRRRRSRCSTSCASPTAARRAQPRPRSEVEIIADLARAVLGAGGRSTGRRWTSARSDPRAIAAVVPGLRAAGGDRRARRQEFHDRRPHVPRAAVRRRRPGKAQFHGPCRLPPLARAAGRVPADDAALRGAVQHRRLRGGGPLPRPGAPRRDHDEPATTSRGSG